MTDREKLISIIDDCRTYVANKTILADHLIANGVRLERKQATSEENKQWIPVSERLPEQYKTVLVWTKNKEMGEAEYDGKHFVWMDDDGMNDYAHATHWMPLPEPPKEEK